MKIKNSRWKYRVEYIKLFFKRLFCHHVYHQVGQYKIDVGMGKVLLLRCYTCGKIKQKII